MYRIVLFAALVITSMVSVAEAVHHGRQHITIALTQEPPNLDTIKMTDLVSFFIVGHVNEGLLRYDRRGGLAPGVAKTWEVAPRRMIFHLRKDATWSNGQPVTAGDFVFAWRQVNDPALAAPFAAIMHPVLNAEKIQNGDLPVEQLGIRAIDDHTLEVLFEGPCGYCPGLMTHATFFPVNEEFYRSRGNGYAAEANALLYNGPFMLTSWTHGSTLTLRKNPRYWNADAIHLNEIRVGYITEDNRTRLNLFRDGRIALARLGPETVRDALDQGLRLKTFVTGGLAYIRFNVGERRPMSHRKLRQAIRYVFDADDFVNKVIGIPGYKPARSFFPSWLNGEHDKFYIEHPPAQIPQDDVKALALVREVREEMGVASLPTLTLLTVTSPTGARIAEFLQGLLAGKLGLRVKVDQQTLKQYLEKSRSGHFDLALSSWYPDFDDIVTYADLLVSWNPNNRGGYRNPDYDRWFRVLQRSADAGERMAAAAELQRIIAEEVPVIPMAETGSAYVQHPKLKGVIRRVIGQDPDYTWARVLP